MVSDVMTVRLHLPQIRVLGVLEDAPGALRVSVESTLLRLRCPQCGFKCRRVHDRRAKRVRDLEVSGRRMTLVWQRRRMVCDNRDSRFLEEHPAFEGALTGRLARRLVADFKIALARRSSRTSCSRTLSRSRSPVVVPGRPPASMSAWRTQARTDSVP